VIGERLRIARRKAGLSLRDLSDRLGGRISHNAIAKYERDEMEPTSAVLIELSRALDVTMEFLAAPLDVRLGELEFRKKSGTSAKDRASVEATVLEHVERYLLIEEILDLDSAEWKKPFNPRAVSTFEEVEKLAQDARSKWNLGNAPILDVVELLEEHGIKVMLLELPDSVSGLTCLVERGNAPAVPVIVVNRTFNLERIRFTLLHELGHRLMKVEGIGEEKAAHRFASAFLMPADHLRAVIGAHRQGFGVAELLATKHVYRVAATALLVRFRDLGIISPEQLTSLFQTTARHWRRSEPEPLPPATSAECPQRFQRLCYRALAEGVISNSKAADLLRQPVAAIARKMNGDEPSEDRCQ
jgi:Zn-dependent peptidase ImmA (M78 family)